MTQSIVQDRTARRTVKALTIVARQECEPLDTGGWIVRDVATGSGAPHIVVNGTCDCQDHTRRAAYCKHLQAVALEERALTQYCADWNARSEQAKNNNLLDLPGNFLDTALNFADSSLTAEDLDWLSDDVNRDEYSGPYGSDGWPQPRPCCPDCGAELESRQYYTGGRGYRMWLVCTRDATGHKALPA